MTHASKTLYLKTIIEILYGMKSSLQNSLAPFNIKNKKTITGDWIKYFLQKKSRPVLSVCLPHCLPHRSVTRLYRGQMKQRTATILLHNKLTAFCGSNECLSSVLWHSFYLQINGHLLHARKPYQSISFLY